MPNESQISTETLVKTIMSGDSLNAKEQFDSLVTARVAEVIDRVKPEVAASLFASEDVADTDQSDTEEEALDGDHVQEPTE